MTMNKENQLTSNITPILDDDAMRQLGFTDHVSTRWYFCRRVGPDITLNITIDKATGTYSEFVMDENFGQHAYYGWMRKDVRDEAIVKIDVFLDKLNQAGLNIELDHQSYGVKIEGESNE